MKRILYRLLAITLLIISLGIFLSLRHISLEWGFACPTLLCMGLEIIRLSNRPTTQARLIVEYQNEMYLLDGEDNPEVEDEL